MTSLEQSAKILLTDESLEQKQPKDKNPTSLISNYAKKPKISILQTRLYMIVFSIFGCAYFINVFVGMLLIHQDYLLNGSSFMVAPENQKWMIERPYNIIEAILLGLFLIENVVILTLYSRQSKKMTPIGLSEVAMDFFLTLIAVVLFLVEILIAMYPIINGFIRLRCLLKLPFMYSLIKAHCNKKQRVVSPTPMPNKTFKTYKDKVVHILEHFNEKLEQPKELNWCLHVIKNDFLQISNSIVANPIGERRFSKTQRIITYDDTIQSSVLNRWISVILNQAWTTRDYTSNTLLVDPKTNSLSDYPITKEVMALEASINSNNFNAFDVHKTTRKNSLYFMLQYVYQKFSFQDVLTIDSIKFQAFSNKIQASYRDNIYHNAIHAADVLQNVYYYLHGANVIDILKATSFDLASLFIAAAAHDVDHPGNNNVYEVKTRSKLATLYNDEAVLENHHAATLFFLLEEDECNIFQNLTVEEFNKMRKCIVDMILYTDMTNHFQSMGDIKAMPLKEDFDPTNKHKPDLMKALVHAADIGNPCRPYEISKVWSLKILSEFFQQGDKERDQDLNITILCDRKTTNISKSQIGFIDFVVLPYFAALTNIMPEMHYTVEQLKSNKEAWAKHVDEYEKQREENGNKDV